jgi:menaquinone-dependent protoporphyrinogen IX oxidase
MANVSISYLTKYGNNRRAMEHLRDRLIELGHEVHLFSVSDTKPDRIPESDLYVFSTSVRMGKLPGKMRKFAKHFTAGTGGSRYALVVTHAAEPTAEKWSPTKTVETMHQILGQKGMRSITKELLIRVKDFKGPLEDDYQEKIDQLAKSIDSSVWEGASST